MSVFAVIITFIFSLVSFGLGVLCAIVYGKQHYNGEYTIVKNDNDEATIGITFYDSGRDIASSKYIKLENRDPQGD